MLCDPKLSLLSGDEQQFESYEERPQHKLTEFRLLLMTLYPFLRRSRTVSRTIFIKRKGLGIELDTIKTSKSNFLNICALK